MLLICDIDGTVANCSHRVQRIPDWDAFHDGMLDDQPIKAVIKGVLAIRNPGPVPCGLFFLTGRPERYRERTTLWIMRNMGLAEYDDYELLMRPDDDYSPDIEFKARTFEEAWKPGGGGPIDLWALRHDIGGCTGSGLDEQYIKDSAIFLEDRDRVVEMWRGKGYTCLQPREGEY